MTNIDKKELKILSRGFRIAANRLINCHPDTGMDLLRKFIAFIDTHPVIFDYIHGFFIDECTPHFEPSMTYQSMGDTKEEEISQTYQYLKYAVENFEDYDGDLAYNYAGNRFDSVKEFNNRIVLPFVNYIEGYLVEIAVKMGFDENIKYDISINGGNVQLNIAEGNIEKPSQTNNGIELNQLMPLLDNVFKHAKYDMPKDELDKVILSIESIKGELQKPQPKMNMVNAALNVIKAVKGSAEFAAAFTVLWQFLQPFLGQG